MNCQEFRKLIDSYLSDELLVETNHDVLRHLESCRECRDQLAAGRDLRTRLRSVVRTMAENHIDDSFAAKLRSDLRTSALRPGIWEQVGAGRRFIGMRGAIVGFACLAMLFVGAFFALRKSQESAATNTDKPIDQRESVIDANKNGLTDAVKVAWNALSEQAVGDHKNCAVKFNLEERPIPLAEAAKKFGPINKDIDKAVMSAVKTGFDDRAGQPTELLEAHSCIFAGRRFTHLVLKNQGKVISVLVTDTDLPAEPDGTVSDHLEDGLNVAGFSIGRHAFFVVSEMNAADNTAIARAIYPAMLRHVAAVNA